MLLKYKNRKRALQN